MQNCKQINIWMQKSYAFLLIFPNNAFKILLKNYFKSFYVSFHILMDEVFNLDTGKIWVWTNIL